jgi:hypothetical protein
MTNSPAISGSGVCSSSFAPTEFEDERARSLHLLLSDPIAGYCFLPPPPSGLDSTERVYIRPQPQPPALSQAWSSFTYPIGETIPPSEFYKQTSSPPNLQVGVGRRTEYLTRFISPPEPILASHAKLKTEQNKTAICLYQKKRQIDMEHERQIEIQRHAVIEI